MTSEKILDWLKTCPHISVIEMSQTSPGGQGLYKEPSGTVEELIDGTQIRKDNYYILFSQNAKLKKERADNETLLENFEKWIYQQNLTKNYPDISKVYGVAINNYYHMMDRGDDIAVYQATLSIEYMYTGV